MPYGKKLDQVQAGSHLLPASLPGEAWRDLQHKSVTITTSTTFYNSTPTSPAMFKAQSHTWSHLVLIKGRQVALPPIGSQWEKWLIKGKSVSGKSQETGSGSTQSGFCPPGPQHLNTYQEEVNQHIMNEGLFRLLGRFEIAHGWAIASAEDYCVWCLNRLAERMYNPEWMNHFNSMHLFHSHRALSSFD